MSHTGKLTRGMKWYAFRNLEGELPKDITDCVNKMKDVDHYLEYCKGKDMKKVDKALHTLRFISSQANGKNSVPYNKLWSQLNDPDFLTAKEKEEKEKKAEAEAKKKAEAEAKKKADKEK